MATSFQALAEKIRLTREELARLNGEQQTASEDEPAALNVLCRMSFAALGDNAQRALILKDFVAAAEENISAN